MLKWNVIGVIFYLLLGIMTVVSKQAASNSSEKLATKLETGMNWRSAKPLPVALQEVYPAEFKGRIYRGCV